MAVYQNIQLGDFYLKKTNQIAGLTFCSITPLPLILLHYLIEQYIVAYVWLPIKQ